MGSFYRIIADSHHRRMARMAALAELLTGGSLTAARAVMTDAGVKPLSRPHDGRVQGFDQADFVKAGDALPAEIRALAQDVADNAFPRTEPPRWPGIEALARETPTMPTWEPGARDPRGQPRLPCAQHRPARRETSDETGRPDSVLGRVRATPPHLRVVWSRPPARPRPDWGEHFDVGVLIAAVCIVAFFGLRSVLTSPLIEALTQ